MTALAVTCPHCGVGPGEQCMSVGMRDPKRRKPTATHTARIAVFVRARAQGRVTA